MKDEEVQSHPAQAVVSFSRQNHSGKRELFGSSLDTHMTSIMLRIKPADRIHHLNYDRYTACGASLIEVELSAAQFAELLTTMNMGEGVPGTIRVRDGQQVDKLPPQQMETSRVRSGFQREMADLAGSVRAFVSSTKETLTKKSLGVVDRQKIMEGLARFQMEIESNIPYVLECFEEATDKVVVAAKAEVDAFMTHNVMQAGLKTILDHTSKEPLELPMRVDESSVGNK